MNEQEHHMKAFEFYYGLGEGRSYNLVAQEFGVALGTVKVWGRIFGWKDRVREKDADAARAMADKSFRSTTEKMARNRKIVDMGLMQVVKAIADGKVRPTISDLDRLVRLEEFLGRGAAVGEAERSLVDDLRRRYANRHRKKGKR